MTAVAGMTGLPPSVLIQPINPERSKYERMWERPEYRVVSPGEQWSQLFLRQARPPHDAEAIDFGCGTGRGALMLALLGAMKVTMLDFAPNCLDPEVAQACETQKGRISFQVQDLTRPIAATAAYGYCCDVMEHIPPEDVRTVLRNILASAQHVFFGISTVDDRLGALIGEPLHLTVEPMAWWVEQLTSLGAVVHWTHEMPEACAIYCSAWQDTSEVVKAGKINTDEAIVDAQVQQNIRDGWNNIVPHDRQDREIVLLAGGPSMRGAAEQIRALRAEGAGIVTVNGAYEWALDQGFVVSAQIVLDAREFNARFTRRVTDVTKYLIASQVHPKTLEGLPRERTFLWHSGITKEAEALVRERLDGNYYPIPGGSTVVLRAIPLLRMLGFARIHLFGFDSCVEPDAHHAYAQAENDAEPTFPVVCGGRTFQCTAWQISQSAEFMGLVGFMGDEIELNVMGDGLIAWIIKTGASIAESANVLD
jgi:2-polyprenyl-3-methyl-5-hydroxy-6-metoxy-1,4-benzoquinol methylase